MFLSPPKFQNPIIMKLPLLRISANFDQVQSNDLGNPNITNVLLPFSNTSFFEKKKCHRDHSWNCAAKQNQKTAHGHNAIKSWIWILLISHYPKYVAKGGKESIHFWTSPKKATHLLHPFTTDHFINHFRFQKYYLQRTWACLNRLLNSFVMYS